MINTYVILALVAVFLIGVFRVISRLAQVSKTLDFLAEFRNKFIALANGYFGASYAATRSADQGLYNWLILNVTKAQNMAGPFGIGTYVASFNIYQVKNCQFLAHLLPNFATGKIHKDEVALLDNVLLRSIGYYQDTEQRYKKDIRNPIKWFQYGIRFILSFPVQLLNWFGIISESAVEKFTANMLFKVISGIIALISFLSSVVGLIGGWHPIIDVMHKVFPTTFK